MARTAPVPNIPAPPGMNPGAFVAGGGGDGGGAGGKGAKGGGGKEGAGTDKGDKDANGDGNNGDACGAGSGGGCPNPKHGNSGTTAGDPVDFSTGRVFTLAATDLVLTGPMPFVVQRTYDSLRRNRDIGLGPGWSHTLGWQLHVGRRRMKIWNGNGNQFELPVPKDGETKRVDRLKVTRIGATFRLTDGTQGRSYTFQPALPNASTERRGGAWFVLTSILDPYGNGLRLHYKNGELNEFSDSAGRHCRVVRNADRIVAFEVQGASGDWNRYRTYAYDSEKNLSHATDAYGNAVEYSYDEAHRLVAMLSPEGAITRYRYNDAGRCFETWCEVPTGDPCLEESLPDTLADGSPAKGFLHHRIDYGADGYVEVVTSRGTRRYLTNRGTVDRAVFGDGVHETSYDERGNLATYEDGVGAKWEWGYNFDGMRIMERDPLGNTTRWTYDDRGHLTKAEYPTNTLEYIRNAQGDALNISDLMGPLVSYERNSFGQIVKATHPAGVTRFEYDAHGNTIQVTEPNGGVRRLEYDFFGLLTAQVDERGHRTEYRYGRQRELLGITMPDGGRIDYAYDREGHLTSIASPLGTQYLLWGGYDMVHTVRKNNGEVVQFRYDREGDLSRIQNAMGESHRIVRDSEGRVIKEHTFDGRTQRYTNDVMGRLVRVEDPNGEFTDITYDDLGRISHRELPDGTSETFEYDWTGRVVSADNGTVHNEFDYDPRGQLISERQHYAGLTDSVDCEFGECGLTRMRSSTGLDLEQQFAGTNRRTFLQLGGTAVSLTWNETDNLVETRFSGGARIRASFDGMQRIVFRYVEKPGVKNSEPEWVGRNPSAVLEQAFSWVPGTELPATAADNFRGTTNYEHDPLGQILKREPAQPPIEVFSYGPDGQVQQGGVAQLYAPGGKVTQVGATEYEYDASNRVIEKRVPTKDGVDRYGFEWNAAGLVAAIDMPDGSRLENYYDSFARRIEKRKLDRDGAPVERTRYVWRSANLLHEETQEASGEDQWVTRESVTYTYLPEHKTPFAHQRTVDGTQEPWAFYVSDNTGRAQALVDDQGELLATYETSAFGRMTAHSPPRTQTKARFTGHWEDQDTGLFYNRYRFYDPDAARYLSPEPAGLEGGIDTFGYARNRPFDWIDPDGRAGMQAHGSGIPPRGSATTEGIPSDQVDLHPSSLAV